MKIALGRSDRKYAQDGDSEAFYKAVTGVIHIKGGDLFIKEASEDISILYALIDWHEKVKQEDWNIQIIGSSSNSSTCELWFNYIRGFIDDISLSYPDIDIDKDNNTIAYHDDDLMMEVAYEELDSKYVIVNINQFEAVSNDDYIKIKKTYDQVSDDFIMHMGFVKYDGLTSIIGSVNKITEEELSKSKLIMDVKLIGKGSVISSRGLGLLKGYRYMTIDNIVNDRFDITSESELEVRVLYVDENEEVNRVYKGIWKVNNMPEGF